MRSIGHSLRGDLYDVEANGIIRVTTPDGKTGQFRADGTYINGDLYFAEPHLCMDRRKRCVFALPRDQARSGKI